MANNPYESLKIEGILKGVLLACLASGDNIDTALDSVRTFNQKLVSANKVNLYNDVTIIEMLGNKKVSSIHYHTIAVLIKNGLTHQEIINERPDIFE